MTRFRLAWSACAGLAVACQIQAPTSNLDGAPSSDAPRLQYADLAVAWTEAGELETCAAALTCPVSGACAEHVALGEPDEQRFELSAGGLLEVAFHCSPLVERQAAVISNEFKIWATVPEGASAVVSVSFDGSTFEDVDLLDEDTVEFDLARAGLVAARSIRVVHQAGGALALDAFEALGVQE